VSQFEPTAEQRAIIDADPVSLAVIACPGSGKTATAVRRLAALRTRFDGSRGYMALLSYSNVAVDTFRDEYQKLAGHAGDGDRVVIQTVDSFITTYLLRPHGARVMKCNRTPFLVLGSEPFLANYRIGSGQDRFEITDVLLARTFGKTVFHRKFRKGRILKLDESIEDEIRQKAIQLAAVGGYTYAFGRAWALSILRKEPKLAAVLAQRFPQIIVDEAQDIGIFEAELLDLLAHSGSVISLIGDVHQSIYGFNFANGFYLREFGAREGVQSLPLLQNRRSQPEIVAFANAIASTDSKPTRDKSEKLSGTYYWRYDDNQLPQLISSWATVLKAAKFDLAESAVLCRGGKLLATVLTGSEEIGQSAVKHFAAAAAELAQRGDVATALEHCAKGVLLLIDGLPEDFISKLKALDRDATAVQMRRLVWMLIRDHAKGIPLANLKAKSEWLPALKANLEAWFELVEAKTPFHRFDTWTNRVTSGKVPDDNPVVRADFGQNEWSGLRFGTVHSVKGEGITAVMYLAKKQQVDALVAGTLEEEGRIGYVAATRARDLLVIAIPKATKPAVIASLKNLGLSDWNSANVVTV
jgi:superfamily I DNA/RNA helicase